MTIAIINSEASFTFGGTATFVPRLSGYPSRGLTALYEFLENTGTAIGDTLDGGDGLIEHPNTANNAYSWLGEGELRLEGTEIVSVPAIDITAAWTLAYIFEMTGSVGGTATERISALVGFRDFTTQPNGTRGVLLFMRGGNDWTGTTTSAFFQVRPGDGAGGSGTSASLTPNSGLTILDQRLVAVLTHDGDGEVTATVYNTAGSAIATATIEVTEAQLTTGTGSNVDTTLQPIIGGPHSIYSGGQQTALGLAVYNRVLADTDVAALIQKAAGL